MKRYFITGTDTGVGKTVVSAALVLALQASYWKPIQSGESDLDQVKKLTQFSDDFFHPANYSLKASLSPDQAAALENMTIQVDHCVVPNTEKILITEGAGGVMAPINETACMLDLIKHVNAPVIIVSRGTLGTINHTLMTIEMLRQRRLPIHGVVFSGELNPENQKAIEKKGNIRTLFHLPLLDLNTLKNWVTENKIQITENFA